FGMPTQPQLLLLQKTMLVTEGIGRALAPDVNMWQLAQPLVEEWALVNLSPPARLRDGAERAAEIARRLPDLAAKAAFIVDETAASCFRQHRDTVDELVDRQARARGRALRWLWALATVALLLAIVALVS